MAEAITGNLDCRGILRGGCVACSCDCYDGGSAKMKCKNCGHPPGKHMNLTKGPESISPKLEFSSGLRCLSPGCREDAYFDPNTGVQGGLCRTHTATDSTDSEASGSSVLFKLANLITSYFVPRAKHNPKDSEYPVIHPTTMSMGGLSNGQPPQHESVSQCSTPAPVPVMDDLILNDLEEEECK